METIIRVLNDVYPQIPTLPGLYRELNLLLAKVNQQLTAAGENEIDEQQLRNAIIQSAPTSKFMDDYINSEGLHFAAVRIPDQPIVLDEETRLKAQEIIKKALSAAPSPDGWYNMIGLGAILKDGGFDYKTLGFRKMTVALDSIFQTECKTVNRPMPGMQPQPYIYIPIELKGRGQSKAKSQPAAIQTQKPAKPADGAPKEKMTPFKRLMNFACFPGSWARYLETLAKKALPEKWYFGREDDHKYSILSNFITMTFERLLVEDEANKNNPKWEPKIRICDNTIGETFQFNAWSKEVPKCIKPARVAIFNTGLVDFLYDPIFAVFCTNPNDGPEWIFWNFVDTNDKEHHTLVRLFGATLPDAAHFDEKTYDPKRKIIDPTWEHIIERCDRMPIEFLKKFGPQEGFDYSNLKGSYKRLSETILNDRNIFADIRERFQAAIANATKHARWNPKTVIPIYYPAEETSSLLLPLSLVDRSKVDLALVLEDSGNDAYIAHTILTIEMAYSSARLLTSADSNWLTRP